MNGYNGASLKSANPTTTAAVWFVLQELERLQTHKQRLHNLQLEQASAVERLGGAVQAVKGDVLAELARERQRLAQVSCKLTGTLCCSMQALCWGTCI